MTACGTPIARGTGIQFFPPLEDGALQAASYDAVVRTLRRNGATVATSSQEVLASVPIHCAGRTLVAELRFARSPGPQSVGVRLCGRDARGAGTCVEGAAERRPSGPCRESTARLLSSIERDLADHLLGKVPVAAPPVRSRWWEDPSLGTLASLVSVRRWAGAARDGWWPATGAMTTIAANPLRAGTGLASLDAARPDASVAPARALSRERTVGGRR